ncbi:MAG: cobalamin biosynthesis protein CobQ [Oscillospiraceae bacterium]|nr:cobalamin biosynthesis protein CobQ [Oscillospiraceae bacterium]
MITIITGHYGSGKSTVAANLAAKSPGSVIVDMDTVNPYYRTADLKAYLDAHGVRLVAPMYARTNLDVPVLDFDIVTICDSAENTVIDMGGDDAGTYPLGKYRSYLSARDDVQMLYTVNFRRMLTAEPSQAAEVMHEIENACGLRITGIINNTNLGEATDEDIIREGIAKAEELSRITGAGIYAHTSPAGISYPDTLPVDVIMDNRLGG